MFYDGAPVNRIPPQFVEQKCYGALIDGEDSVSQTRHDQFYGLHMPHLRILGVHS